MWEYETARCFFCGKVRPTTERELDGMPIRACDACLCDLALGGQIGYADLPAHMKPDKK